MKLQYITLLALAIFFNACTPAETKESLDKAVVDAEQSLYGENGTFRFNDSLANKVIGAYEAYANAFKEDPKSADYLFKTADAYRSLKKYDEAIAIYDRIEAEHPTHEKMPQCYFLKGFVYENEMGDLPKAKASYEGFLAKYPDHELADDVQFSLNNLGRSPEEIIKEFERKRLENEAKMAVDTAEAA